MHESLFDLGELGLRITTQVILIHSDGCSNYLIAKLSEYSAVEKLRACIMLTRPRGRKLLC